MAVADTAAVGKAMVAVEAAEMGTVTVRLAAVTVGHWLAVDT